MGDYLNCNMQKYRLTVKYSANIGSNREQRGKNVRYIYKNGVLFLIIFASVVLNVHFFIVIIDKAITESYQESGLYTANNIIKTQEALLDFYWKGKNKTEVISLLNNLIDQQSNADFFIAEKHENLVVFSDLNFYFRDNKLEKITSEFLDEKYNIRY